MKKNLLKIFSFIALIFMIVGCTPLEGDEMLIVGEPWYWTKTVHYDMENGKLYENYIEYSQDNEVYYKFYDNGDILMRNTYLNKFDHQMVDVVNGHWDLWNDELSIITSDGEWNYHVERLSSFTFIISYEDEYYSVDDFGNKYLVKEYVEEYYER